MQDMVECSIGPWCLPPFLEMLRATGARRGEVLALRWCDIRDGAAFIDGCWIQASLHVLTGVFCAFLVFSIRRKTATNRRRHDPVMTRSRFRIARRVGGWPAPSWRTGHGGCVGAARLDLGSWCRAAHARPRPGSKSDFATCLSLAH